MVPEPPVGYDTVALDRAVDLRRVAEWTSVSVDEIQALNPELRRWTTPVRNPRYNLKVPQGSAESLLAKLDAAPPTEFAALKWHTVRRGETVTGLARRFRVSRSDLADANGLSLKSRLRPGEPLLIPRVPAPLLATRSATAVARASGPRERDAAVTATYRVKRGDTLSAIARQFQVGVDELRSWNRLRDSRIAPGDVLRVGASSSSQVAQ